MKKLIVKVGLFFLPVSILFIEIMLPKNQFTYRPWEALLFYHPKKIAYPYYPNQNLAMHSVGDLGYRTKNEIPRYENWHTDKLGYRNDSFITSPDVLIIGDSYIVGTGLPQDSTLSNTLHSISGLQVYNMASAMFKDFVDLLSNEIIQKPKFLIYSIIEQNLPQTIPTTRRKFETVKWGDVFKDRLSRFYMVNYFGARWTGSCGRGFPGVTDSSLLFLSGKNIKYHHDDLPQVAKTIEQYQHFCDSIGVHFIFLPIPNKETIYYKQVPLESQPDYITRLNDLLATKKIATIQTQQLFNSYVSAHAPQQYIYQKDDSHWNATGIKLTAEAINSLLQSYKY